MNRKILLFILFIFIINSLFAVIEETASFKAFLYGNAPECEYDNWNSHIAEGIASPGYNVYASWDRQMDGFGDFIIPTDSMLVKWENTVLQFLAGNLDEAQDSLDLFEFPYQVVIFNDTDTDRTYHILRELPNMEHYDNNDTNPHYDDEVGAFDYGWGLYVYYPEGQYPHITTAPHPNDDYPSVPFAHKVFVEQESKFLLISGAGREVKWTEEGDYNNSKSLSDPSRASSHPFNICYRRFCDLIRDEFGQKEFSIQVHTYDWGNSHWGYPDVQISGGYNVASPDLPIRDFSSARKDVVNQTGYIVHQANTVGIHPPVYTNDFFGFHYSRYDFTYSDEDTTFSVSNHTDLWGYSQNRQMQYTQSGMNQYDNFEPFFHIEMDELPNIYPQNTNNYFWFYGWNPVTQMWDLEHRFDRFIQYYSPWLESLTGILPDMFQMDDGEMPVTPTDFQTITECSNYITLQWTPGDCYDLDSYEILYAAEPIGDDNFTIRDKSDDTTLACLAETNHTIGGLEQGQEYYFKIRIRDKNGNYSELSDEISSSTGPAIMSNLETYGRDGYVDVSWDVPTQNGCVGFNVYHKTNATEFILIDSWLFNPGLLGVDLDDQTYSIIDNSAENGEYYIYQISCNDQFMEEYFYGNLGYASPQKVFEIYVEQNEGTFDDTCYFGMNPYASNGYDADSFDIPTDDDPSGEYFFCEFFEENWDPPNKFEQEIYSQYDPFSGYKRWTFRFRTNQNDESVEIGIANLDRNSDRLYLYRNGNWTNLTYNTYSFFPANSNYYTFDLYYGNLVPDVDFGPFANQLLYPNETVNFDWSLDFQIGIDHLNLYAENNEITIPIETGLAPNQTEVDWFVPTLLFDNLRLKLEVVMLEGDILTFYSSSKFGIVTSQNIIETFSGWDLVTQNFETGFYEPEEVYGENSVSYEYFEGDFYESDPLEFLQPYWLFAPQDFYFVVENAGIQRTAYDYNLRQGWNLLPNPHRTNYHLDQLQFILDETVYEYYEAVQQRFIEPVVFRHEQRFIPVDELLEREAYYLYCYEDDLEARFIPYRENSFSPEFAYNWKLEINAARNPERNSSVIVGTSDFADSLYNSNYDLLKPLDKPFTDCLTFSLPYDFSNEGYFTDYHQILTEPQNTEESFSFEWNAKLELPNLEPIDFNIFPDNLPEDHLVFLILPDLILDLHNDEPRTYTPSDSLLNFFIVITDDELVANDENKVHPQTISMINYPNPFYLNGASRNSSTMIKYTIPRKGKTELKIYNIKGQKVKTLVNKVQENGKYEIPWFGKDEFGKNVGSGVYFYRLEVDNKKTLVRKMLLLR